MTFKEEFPDFYKSNNNFPFLNSYKLEHLYHIIDSSDSRSPYTLIVSNEVHNPELDFNLHSPIQQIYSVPANVPGSIPAV